VSDFGIRRALQSNGIDPEKDVTFTQVADIQAEVAAVSAGQAKAFVAFPPDDLLAKRIGMKELYNVDDLKLPYVQASLFTRREFLEKNPEVVLNFMNGLVEGIHLMKTNPTLANDAFIKYTNTQDREIATRAVEFSSQLIDRIPAITEEGMKNVLSVVGQQNTKVATADTSKLWDRTATDAVAKSGLVDRLYR
jgi:ABC-type nitrate/sulfonate/bicarbonate transport system substrate-binding protein